ncbi:unnamed protein product [Allacma fusca]|uniref:Uncharacterized protein n=1 Tax=Allacma fusca TaxID=39272 RepID=A0A8J2NL38_9HEXA|nr:unnamed protein product [Allacma fusca]
MKAALVFVALCVAGALAAPQLRQNDVQIVSQNNDNDGSGNFRNSYALNDGTAEERQGEFRPIDAETGIQKVTGVISWTSPEGQLITLRYVADENGFQPQGDHLPRA